MDLKLMYSGGNLEGFHVTCYHCPCGKGEIIEEYNSVTDRLHITIDCAICREKYKVVYKNSFGIKTFDLKEKDKYGLDNGLCGGDSCIIKEL